MALLTKKQEEERCFSAAIKKAMENGGEARRVALRLSGSPVKRNREEEPDFLIQRSEEANRTCLVGVEHFYVDCFAEEKIKDGSVLARTPEVRRSIHQLSERYQGEALENEWEFEDAVRKLIEISNTVLRNHLEKTYSSFLKSFSHAIDKHRRRIPTYIRNVRSVATNGESQELAFLVEVNSDFRDLILVDARGKRSCALGRLPMFADLVEILSTVSSRVQYIIISSHAPFAEPDDCNVIACKAGNLEKELRKQHEEIYEYAGIDMQLKGFQRLRQEVNVVPSIQKEIGKITWTNNVESEEIDPKTLLSMRFTAARKALACESAGIPYAVDKLTEFIVELIEGRILGWDEFTEDGIIFSRPSLKHIEQEEFDRRAMRFENKWLSGNG